MNLAADLLTEIEWVSDWEGCWYCEERYQSIKQRVSQAERDRLCVAIESLRVRMDMAEYLEREEAVQWLVVGLVLGNPELRSRVDANQFASYIHLIVSSIQTGTWSHENDHNLKVLLGVVRGPGQKLIDAVLATFEEDAEARKKNGKSVGFGGKRWERMMRLKQEREKIKSEQ